MTASDASVLEKLLETNVQPTADERSLIQEAINSLEAEYHSIAGRPFTLADGVTSTITVQRDRRRTKKCTEAILLRRRVLSSIRAIPVEVLQHIFGIIAEDGKGLYSSYQWLTTLYSVCKGWRGAAISHCGLWTCPPPIFLHHGTPAPDVREMWSTWHMFVQRSGSLPIAMCCLVDWKTWLYREDLVREIFGLMMDHSNRWKDVRLELPSALVRDLLPAIKGRLQSLTTLDFSFSSSAHPDVRHDTPDPVIIVDAFEDAPALRSVKLCPRSPLQYPISLHNILLPWQQLHDFENFTYADDDTYLNLTTSQSKHIKSIKFYSTALSNLPLASPLLLPQLEVLDLRSRLIPRSAFRSHLAQLTLPALKSFSVRGNKDTPPSDPLFECVEAMIGRSRCSLLRLTLSRSTGQERSLRGIFLLSPHLEYLDIEGMWSMDLDYLSLLVVKKDASEDEILLPKLSVLTLRDVGGEGEDHPDTLRATVVGGELAQVFKSRTEEADGTARTALTELGFIYNNTGTLSVHLRYLAPYLDESLLQKRELNDWAKDAAEFLGTTLLGYWDVFSRPRGFNPILQAKLDRKMRNIESIKLCQGASKILTLHGIPHFLRQVSNMAENLIPGDSFLGFRSRAEKLLDKWKDTLIHERRNTSVRWSHFSQGIAFIKYVPYGSGDSQGRAGEMLPEEKAALWEEITGEMHGYAPPVKWESLYLRGYGL